MWSTPWWLGCSKIQKVDLWTFLTCTTFQRWSGFRTKSMHVLMHEAPGRVACGGVFGQWEDNQSNSCNDQNIFTNLSMLSENGCHDTFSRCAASRPQPSCGGSQSPHFSVLIKLVLRLALVFCCCSTGICLDFNIYKITVKSWGHVRPDNRTALYWSTHQYNTTNTKSLVIIMAGLV